MFGLQEPDKELTLQRRDHDKLGHSHLRFSQSYRGLPVFGAEVIAQLDSAGNLISINGSYSRSPSKKFITTAALSAAQADRAARSAILSGLGAKAVVAPQLMIYRDNGRPTLVWRVRLLQGAPNLWSVFVNARTGAIVAKYNERPTENVLGSGLDLYGTSRSLNVWHDATRYVMMDTTKPMYAGGDPLVPSTQGVIRVLDANNQPPTDNLQLFLVQSASQNGIWLPDAVSASFNFAATYDYFETVHGRNSYDGLGGSLTAVVRYGMNYQNAFYAGNGYMYFGDALPYASALDVVAHELTHGVTTATSNLVYQGQSGALNEHFSDVFGEMTEAWARGAPDWLIRRGYRCADSQLYRSK